MTDRPSTATRTDVDLSIKDVDPEDVNRVWETLAGLAQLWIADGLQAELRTYTSSRDSDGAVDVETVSDPDPAARAEE